MTMTLQPSFEPAIIARRFITPQRNKGRARPALPGADQDLSFDFSGTRIHAQKWGAGPAVLLVHGWEGSQRDMGTFLVPLLQAGHSVVALDFQAHGNSGGETATIPQMARTIQKLADTAGPFKALIAHSVGCAASQVAMAQGVGIERAVLISSPLRYRAYAEAMAAQHGLTGPAWVAIHGALNDLGCDVDRVDAAHYGPQVSAECLFLHSQDDRVVPAPMGQAAAEFLPCAKFELVDGLGHARILGDDAIVQRAVDHITAASL